jgi:oligoendopeptidase F
LNSVTADSLLRWDLSNVYPSLESDKFVTAKLDVKRELDELDAFLAEHRVMRSANQMNAQEAHQLKFIVDEYLNRTNAALRLYSTLNAFVSSYVTTESYNTSAKRLESELEILGIGFRKQGIRFQAWVGSISDELPRIVRENGTARVHEFFLRETAEQSRYMMTDPEESLAAELELSGANAWSKLQGTICSQLTVNFELDGKLKRMPITALMNLNHHPDAEVRRRAYDAELAAWETAKEPLAAALNGVKGNAITVDKRRGRVDALHASLDQCRLDRETLNTMLNTTQNSFPTFRQYLKAKAKRLGHDRLPWWDIFAPVGRNERRFTWAEARKFIVNQFRTFSDHLADLAQRAFENNWIDAEPRDGKRGGAFCMELPSVDESRILCNFDGSLDEVSTVAHELGHAYHNECQVGKTMLQTRTPMTLAETASTFNETIITEAALGAAANREEEIAILENTLINSTQVIVDITSRFLFEKEVFERREKSELSADDFCEIMLRCQKATYGDGLDDRYLHKYMWTWKPHYYIPSFSFYNYPYAFGLLFGTGLYALYKERGKSFVKDYEALLSSTGEGTPADLAMRFGIDIHKPDFWQNSLKVVEERIQRYLEL